jgi:hypothetical protein
MGGVTTLMLPALPVLHLGSLHAYETALVLLLAFGPFVALGVIVFVVRRRDLAAEHADGTGSAARADRDGRAARADQDGRAEHDRQDAQPADPLATSTGHPVAGR